ncbi:MAG TPA: carotenoid biosynthesis protein [Pseudolabrys sp.]|nr:carotenoid biosynthesis protein [Pseudolabrys sp.]
MSPKGRSARMTMENMKIDGRWSHSMREVALWLAIACVLLAAIGFSWNPTPFAHALAAIFIACALVHAGFFYGSRPALVLFIICVAITFTMENIGAVTGFPFGHYHFAIDAGLPRIGSIPIIVGPLWFGAGYFSWVVASILLDGADRRLDRPLDFIALPVVAAFVMTQWDLVMDPPESTIAKVWIWHDGGANFGVPLSNYLGWLLTSWLFFQIFALYLRHRIAERLQSGQRSKLQLIAVLFYVSLGLTHIVPWAMGQSGEIADAAGKTWRIHDLRETTVTIMLFTMFFSAMLATLHLAKENR